MLPVCLRLVCIAAMTLLTVAYPTVTSAQSPRERLIVSAGWVAEHLKDPDLVLLHVGDKDDYAARHVPGARHVALTDISQPSADGSLTLEMLPPERLRERLQALGISNTSRVVVYFAKDWISPATRVIFTLDYAGLERVSLLDGGLEAWTRAGQTVTDAVPSANPGSLEPLAPKPLIVDADFVRSHARTSGFAVVDARDLAFYDGTKTGGRPELQHKTGHIAGAKSVPFSSIARDDLTIRGADELTAAFAKAGIKPDDTVVTYCHIGQQATATLFAARTLGYKVLLYDGSFQDWSRRGYEVEKD